MNILFPIETLNRELDYRLLLAAQLGDLNHSIFISQYQFLDKMLPFFNNGIYVGKNIFKKRSDIDTYGGYYKVKKKGFDVVYLHEEGAVYSGTEADWKEKLSALYNINVFDENDRVCVWGTFQRDYDVSRIANRNIPVIATGHPRFELYKKYRGVYKSDVEKIKSQYGDFILINGNYGRANHRRGLSYQFSDKANYIVSDVVKRLQKVDYYVGSAIQLAKMIELTHCLAVKYPHLNFVYRPHPIENHSFYETIFRGVSNIYTVHEGSVGPWILAAKAIIHDGCTTGIEAQLSDIPVINYKPLYSETNSNYLPNEMGRKATTIEDVYKLVNEALRSPDGFLQDFHLSELAESLMMNFKADAFELLLEVIRERIKNHNMVETKSPSTAAIRKLYYYREAKLTASKVYRRIKGSKRDDDYQLAVQKFGGFNENEIRKKIQAIETLLGRRINYNVVNKYLIKVN